MTRIAVIGAGIGGLTAALALSRLGRPVTLYERAPALQPLGASLSLWPNAMNVLDRLGVADALRPHGADLTRVALREGGSVLTQCDLSAINADLGAGLCTPRAALHDALRCALPDGVLQLGMNLNAVSQTGDTVDLSFADGRRERAEMVIAADGLHSSVRAELWADAPPAYAGYSSVLGIADTTPNSVLPGEAAECYGPGGRLGTIPTGHGRCYWFFVRDMARQSPNAVPIAKAEIAAWLDDWPPFAKDLLGATADDTLYLAPIHDRAPTRVWGKGRVLLLGDALHPFTPNLGQGAGMAIEDAAVLASLITTGIPTGALARTYRNLRAARVHGMARQARMIGKLAQKRGLFAGPMRRMFFGLASERQMQQRLRHQFTLPGATRKLLDAAGLVA